MAKRVGVSVAVVAAIGITFGTLVMFAWTIDETHFDRPDERFDRLAATLEAVPGVSVDERARWVEAPTFSDPSSWIRLTVDEANLPALLSVACTADYSEEVSWSLRVSVANKSSVSLNADGVDRSPCPDFGFDAVGLVGDVGASLPGLDLQATIWDNGRFALAALDGNPATLSALLPLVDHAEGVRDAAGLDPRRSIDIDTATLGATIYPEEHDRYRALLSELVENRAVTSFWADTEGGQAGGVDRVQIVAPDSEHAGIERAIRASGLEIADLPVRFIPLTP
jgi:hypothetical protein